MAIDQTDGILRQIRRTALARAGDELPDDQLLECFIARRDADAFEVLVRRHGPMVLGVCRRLLRDPHHAEDAFQATFLVLVRKAASLRQRDLLGNWLHGVACRTAREARAMMARRRTNEMQVGHLPEPAAPAAEADDLPALLDEELGRLPEHYRAVIVLCDLEGRARREAARLLGVPDGTLSNRLASARRMLARRLARRGVTPAGAALAAALTQNQAEASVPGALIESVTRAAAAGAISPPVAALTERVVKAMLLTKLKISTAALAAALVLVGGATGLLLPDSRADGPGKDFRKLEAADAEQLRGTWRVVRREVNHVEQAPMFEYYDWTFDGRKAAIHWKMLPTKADPPEEHQSSYSCTINPGKSPKELTIFGDAVLLQCIYKLEGDRLSICHYGISEIDRPRAFTPNENGPSVTPLIVWELKRVGGTPAASPAPGAGVPRPEPEIIQGRSQRYRTPPKRPQTGTWPAGLDAALAAPGYLDGFNYQNPGYVTTSVDTFFFSGGTEALNQFLKKLAAVRDLRLSVEFNRSAGKVNPELRAGVIVGGEALGLPLKDFDGRSCNWLVSVTPKERASAAAGEKHLTEARVLVFLGGNAIDVEKVRLPARE